jgi:HPt (histidine-containing phosphotransfer) domain-containing protein
MYINAGFDDYITKPIDPDRLETMLLAYLPKGKIAPPDEETDEDDVPLPDFIFTIPELDIGSGLRHCGSKRSYMLTLRTYLDNAVKNADEIEKLWNAGDLKNTTIRVHALKSTSRVIGALALGDHAAELEKAGDAEDIEKLEKELPDLLAAYRKLASSLEPLNSVEEQDQGEDNRPLISDDYLNEAYTALSEFCASFDYDSVAHVVESLSAYRMPEDEVTRYELLVKAVDNYDYDLIPGILDRGKE